jgi:hypothetical protein
MELIETEKFVMKIHDENDLLEYSVKPGVLLDIKEVLHGKKLLSEARPGKKFFVLATGFELFTISKEARKITATAEYGDNTHAIAFYTPNPSIFLLGKMYIQINKPLVPTSVFYHLHEAREWLYEQMKAKH